jgi:hypothetical protein
VLSKTEKSTNLHYKKIWGQKRLTFKDKRLNLDKNPRKDRCEWCNRGIGDEYIDSRGRIKNIDKMHIHHVNYHDDDPTKDTFTLCPSCHLKEGQRLKKLKQEPRKCDICYSTKTKIQTKRYPSGHIIEFERWHRNPLNKKWLCFNCYNKIAWKLGLSKNKTRRKKCRVLSDVVV